MSNVFQGMNKAGSAAEQAATERYGEEKYGEGNALQKALMRLQAADAFDTEEEEVGPDGIKRRRNRPMDQPDLSSFVSLRPGQPMGGGNMMDLYSRLYSSYGGRPTRGGLLGD